MFSWHYSFFPFPTPGFQLIQKILYLVDYQRELEVSQNDEYIQKLADAGMEITYVTPENKALFAEKVAPMYDDAAEQFGQDVMDAVAPYRGQ